MGRLVTCLVLLAILCAGSATGFSHSGVEKVQTFQVLDFYDDHNGVSSDAPEVVAAFDAVASEMIVMADVENPLPKPILDLSYVSTCEGFRTNVRVPPEYRLRKNENKFHYEEPAQCRLSLKKNDDLLYHSLEASYIVLNVADYLLTRKGIAVGAKELNPIMAAMMKYHLFAPVKTVFVGVGLYSCRRIRQDDPQAAKIILIVSNILYSAIVFNNYQVVVNLKL